MKKFRNTPNKPIAATPVAKPEMLQTRPVSTEPAAVQPVKITPVRSVPASKPKVETVSFELVRPGAKCVFVAGSFNDWKPESAPLMPKDNGRWVGDLTIKPGKYEYLFVVDGQWMPDPNAKESVQNPFGGRNSVIGVSG
ncbi:MAG TPA: glycogen-binding domain-containing protein [Verrucomicrobiae bacterium]|nr:glycogen-binding domain-containing protein [Verrucomicrobiae bacterium]